eukprot:UN05042
MYDHYIENSQKKKISILYYPLEDERHNLFRRIEYELIYLQTHVLRIFVCFQYVGLLSSDSGQAGQLIFSLTHSRTKWTR